MGTLVRGLGCIVLLFFNFNVVWAQGQLYGMTARGGSNNQGVLFKTNADGTGQVILKDFLLSSTEIGMTPRASLTMAANGKLYGMTYEGGSNLAGVLFEYDPGTSQYAKKKDFETNTIGGYPLGSLTLANSKLFGMASGGSNGWGTLFEYNPATDAFSKKYDFALATGALPNGSLTLASNGKLYGLAANGGSNGTGVLFEYDPVTSIYSKKVDFIRTTNGSSP